MPTKVEKDSVTGTETTGHEWDGIKELNTPLPRWWVYVFYATIVYAVIYVILYPGIPGFDGVLDWNRRVELTEQLAEARAAQAQYVDAIRQSELAAVRDDPELLTFAMAGGEAAFADNCAPCHGQGGAGRPGYPTLADDAWMWGGTPEAIHRTLQYGIRSDHPETRSSQMPAFGDFMDRGQLEAIADYVLSLSGRAPEGADLDQGGQLYAENCVACHGENGGGMTDLGAPALNDPIWLFGGEKADIIAQMAEPQHGVMPAWSGRLEPETIKMLAVYVHALGGGQ